METYTIKTRLRIPAAMLLMAVAYRGCGAIIINGFWRGICMMGFTPDVCYSDIFTMGCEQSESQGLDILAYICSGADRRQPMRRAGFWMRRGSYDDTDLPWNVDGMQRSNRGGPHGQRQRLNQHITLGKRPADKKKSPG